MGNMGKQVDGSDINIKKDCEQTRYIKSEFVVGNVRSRFYDMKVKKLVLFGLRFKMQPHDISSPSVATRDS